MTDLREIGADLAAKLDESFPDQDRIARQGLAIAEEAGELVGAIRRYHGMARRTGTFEEMSDEWADVVITAYVTAAVLGIDPERAIDSKLERIYSRGWRDD